MNEFKSILGYVEKYNQLVQEYESYGVYGLKQINVVSDKTDLKFIMDCMINMMDKVVDHVDDLHMMMEKVFAIGDYRIDKL